MEVFKTKESIQRRLEDLYEEWEEDFNNEMNKNLLELYFENVIQNAVYRGELNIYPSSKTISEIAEAMIQNNKFRNEIDSRVIEFVNNLSNPINPIIIEK